MYQRTAAESGLVGEDAPPESGFNGAAEHGAGDAAAYGTHAKGATKNGTECLRQRCTVAEDDGERCQHVSGCQQRHEPLEHTACATHPTEQDAAQQNGDSGGNAPHRQGKGILQQGGDGAALGHIPHAE